MNMLGHQFLNTYNETKVHKATLSGYDKQVRNKHHRDNEQDQGLSLYHLTTAEQKNRSTMPVAIALRKIAFFQLKHNTRDERNSV